MPGDELSLLTDIGEGGKDDRWYHDSVDGDEDFLETIRQIGVEEKHLLGKHDQGTHAGKLGQIADRLSGWRQIRDVEKKDILDRLKEMGAVEGLSKKTLSAIAEAEEVSKAIGTKNEEDYRWAIVSSLKRAKRLYLIDLGGVKPGMGTDVQVPLVHGTKPRTAQKIDKEGFNSGTYFLRKSFEYTGDHISAAIEEKAIGAVTEYLESGKVPDLKVVVYDVDADPEEMRKDPELSSRSVITDKTVKSARIKSKTIHVIDSSAFMKRLTEQMFFGLSSKRDIIKDFRKTKAGFSSVDDVISYGVKNRGIGSVTFVVKEMIEAGELFKSSRRLR